MAGSWITKHRRLAIYLRDNHKCAYCNKSHEDLSLDHIVPKAKGGRNNNDNLITACGTCNKQKGTKSFAEYVGYLDAMLIANAQEIRQRVRRRRRRSMAKYYMIAKRQLDLA